MSITATDQVSQPLTLNGDKTFDLSHTYADDGDYRVTVSVRDDDMVDPEWWVNRSSTCSWPTCPRRWMRGADAAVDEGSLFSRSGSFIDPGADSWTARVDYGDGSGVQPLTLNGDKTFDLSHTYADDGDYRVTVSVRDDDMVDPEWWVESFFDVFVANVPPTVDAGADAAVDEGSLFSRSGSFIDPGADSWTARVDYGDGSGVQPLTLNGDKTFDLSHTYADDGDYRSRSAFGTTTWSIRNGGWIRSSTCSWPTCPRRWMRGRMRPWMKAACSAARAVSSIRGPTAGRLVLITAMARVFSRDAQWGQDVRPESHLHR